MRWQSSVQNVIEQINALDYDLVLVIQTRIDSHVLTRASPAQVGNIHIKRNMVGAAIGV